MIIYLDTSVVNIYLFGKYSEIEADKYQSVTKLFRLINSGKITAVISLYTIQEIYCFCKKVFASDDAGGLCRLFLYELFKNEIEITGLLSREERLLHRGRFAMQDSSDQPHAISAFINKCNAVVTYDRHFQKIKDILHIYTPDEITARL